MAVTDHPASPTGSEAARLAGLLRQSRRTVVFTGAGMSTESGLPDFRSQRGLWQGSRRFEQLASVDALHSSPDEFIEFYRWRIRLLGRYGPHAGHAILAGWQQCGLVSTLITQNVDGFHQEAGSSDVLCLHGTLRTVHCHACGRRAPANSFLEDTGLSCASCRGPMRPSVVLFGEALDQDTLEAAFEASASAELFLILGSSLVVSPANQLPVAAVRAGATLCIVNREKAAESDRYLLDLRAQIGPTLAAADAVLSPAEGSRP